MDESANRCCSCSDEAVDRLADEVQTLRTAIDDLQDCLTFELRRLRDVLCGLDGGELSIAASDTSMAADGVCAAARHADRRTLHAPGPGDAIEASESDGPAMIRDEDPAAGNWPSSGQLF
jgi:hypothetical protein